jgi:hypothetical protein
VTVHEVNVHVGLVADTIDIRLLYPLIVPSIPSVARVGALPVEVVEDGAADIRVADPSSGANALVLVPRIDEDTDVVRPEEVARRALVLGQRGSGSALAPGVAQPGRQLPGALAGAEERLREVDAVSRLPLMLVAGVLEQAQVLDIGLQGVAPRGGAVGLEARIVAALGAGAAGVYGLVSGQ